MNKRILNSYWVDKKLYETNTQRAPDTVGYMKILPGLNLNFSLKRALGITALQRKIARATGIPMTKAGRQRKIGKMLGMK